MNTPRRVVLVYGIVLCAWRAYAQEATPSPSGPVPELKDGFTLSSTQKSGKLEWKVDGSSGVFLTPNIIEMKDVRAVYYPEDGTNVVATTARAILNQETRQVTTDEFVTIVTETSVTTGTGLDWDNMKKRGTLKKNVKVVYTAAQGKGLLK